MEAAEGTLSEHNDACEHRPLIVDHRKANEREARVCIHENIHSRIETEVRRLRMRRARTFLPCCLVTITDGIRALYVSAVCGSGFTSQRILNKGWHDVCSMLQGQSSSGNGWVKVNMCFMSLSPRDQAYFNLRSFERQTV